MMDKHCGSCALCCKLLDVQGLAPQGVWCKHAAPGQAGGCCTIHEERPPQCFGFECLWRESPVLGPELKPERCKIVFELYREERLVIAMVDEARPDAWKTGQPAQLIEQILSDGYFMWVRIGKTKHLLLPKGLTQTEAIEKTKAAYRRKFPAPNAAA